MESLMKLVTWKLPIGESFSTIVDMLTITFSAEFRAFSSILEGFITGMSSALMAPHPLIIVLLFTVGSWFIKKSKSTTIFCFLGFLLILNLNLWTEMIETLALILTATLISLALGIPLGILSAHSKTFRLISQPILDFMQTIPAFVYLIPALMFFGLGEVPGVIATVIFAMPPCMRLTNLGIMQVPMELKEAGVAFGANIWQMLYKIEIPCAFPSIMMGINQTIMMALSMVVIAALIGAGGLGAAVMRSLAVVDVGMGIESGLGIVVLAMVLDRIIRIK